MTPSPLPLCDSPRGETRLVSSAVMGWLEKGRAPLSLCQSSSPTELSWAGDSGEACRTRRRQTWQRESPSLPGRGERERGLSWLRALLKGNRLRRVEGSRGARGELGEMSQSQARPGGSPSQGPLCGPPCPHTHSHPGLLKPVSHGGTRLPWKPGRNRPWEPGRGSRASRQTDFWGASAPRRI